MNTKTNLTEETQKLLFAIVRDSPNWSGTPPCFNHITAASRGNLTDLKRKGMVSTFRSDGEEWIEIKPAGIEYAKANMNDPKTVACAEVNGAGK